MFLKDFRLPFERCQGSKDHKACDKKVWQVPNHPLATEKQKCLSRWCFKHTIERGICWNCGKEEQYKDFTCRACYDILALALAPYTVREIVGQILKKKACEPPIHDVQVN